MELKGLKINFLGDSITEGHGASSPENCFVSLIARDTGAICRNYGIGGSRIAYQTKPSENPRHDRDFPGRIDEMEPDADFVVVFGGTNDFGHGDAPLGCPSNRTKATFYGAMHEMCLRLIERYPTSKIVIITPLHRWNEDRLTGDNKTNDVAPLSRYVEIIREVAEYYSLPVLDLYANSGIQPKVPILREKYAPDGLHPNDAGYRILAEKITNFLMHC